MNASNYAPDIVRAIHKTHCPNCLDTGLFWSALGGSPAHCDYCTAAREPLHSPAVQIFRQRTFDRMKRGSDITPLHFHLARALTLFSGETPVLRESLDKHFNLSERKTKDVLKFLRDNWLLPIGGRKQPPAGAWLIVTDAEFIEYERQARRTAISALATLYKIRRANFPRLAGQLALDFVEQVKQGIEEEVLF
jgi:hypothetical protein